MSTKNTCEEFDEFLDRPVAYHRIFKLVSGSVAGGVMLSQAHYWTLRATLPNGWFYKTVDQWKEETGLTRYEQETARKKLRDTSFWQEQLRGVPGKLHFRIDRPMLRTAIIQAQLRYRTEHDGEMKRRQAVAAKRVQAKYAALPRTEEVSEASTRVRCVPGAGNAADREAGTVRTITENTHRVTESTSSCGQQSCPPIEEKCLRACYAL
jgi:hypothetical protein